MQNNLTTPVDIDGMDAMQSLVEQASDAANDLPGEVVRFPGPGDV